MIVFDLDGTLCDTSHAAAHHLSIIPKNWPAFYRECCEAPPIWQTIRLLSILSTSHRDVAIWTGRCESVRTETKTWLMQQGIATPILSEIRMRPLNDHTEDHVMKQQWLHETRVAGKQVEMAFEDRLRCVEMWREEGVFCFHVGGGDF